jgi:hypothetical protein
MPQVPAVENRENSRDRYSFVSRNGYGICREISVGIREGRTAPPHRAQVEPAGPQPMLEDFPEVEWKLDRTRAGLSAPHFGHCKEAASASIL